MTLHKLAAATAAACVLGLGAANASIVRDGNVALGVGNFGNLNFGIGTADVAGETTYGVRWIAADGTEFESTSHGCFCEGWGISVDETISGTANRDNANFGLTGIDFTTDGAVANSVVQLDGTDVFVTHNFSLSEDTDNLYEIVVTIENRGTTDVSNVRYRRAMDWDTSPTPFDEYVTIGGTATTTLLASSSNDGFVNTDPLSGALGEERSLAPCGVGVDFTACIGPEDHGAAFDFNFGDIAAGDDYVFSIFYGGAMNLAAANSALFAAEVELFSYGWSLDDANQNGVGDVGTGSEGEMTPTFIFGFSGVGGTVVIPDDPMNPIPLPAGVWLLIGALGGLGLLRRRAA